MKQNKLVLNPDKMKPMLGNKKSGLGIEGQPAYRLGFIPWKNNFVVCDYSLILTNH